MDSFWTVLALIASLLQLATIWLMQSRGFYVRFPTLFLYVIVSWLAAIVEWTAYHWENYASYYWTNELILQILIFLTMMHFIYLARGDAPGRWRNVFLIGLGVVAATVISALLYDAPMQKISADRKATYAMTLLSRNLSFFSALLNLVLWQALLKNRRRDNSLLLLSTGIGLLTTGKAIGHSLRVISKDLLIVGNMFVVLSALMALVIWFWTFRQAQARRTADASAATPNR